MQCQICGDDLEPGQSVIEVETVVINTDRGEALEPFVTTQGKPARLRKFIHLFHVQQGEAAYHATLGDDR